MSFANVLYALEELSKFRIPDEVRVLRGLSALDPILVQSGHEKEIYDAGALLQTLVATGGIGGTLTGAPDHAAGMAAAVRRLIGSA